MKISATLLSSFLLLLLFSVELSSALAVHGGLRAVRIPEHTCHKTFGSAKCELQNCIRECSKEPSGLGMCKGTVCFCQYYCKEPPL